MSHTSCCQCQKSKAPLTCGICEQSVCKSCSQIMEEDAFSFLAEKPAELSHLVYCGACYDAHVAEPLNSYNETMEQAKDIQIFLKSQGKETRLLKRIEKPVQVKDCGDHDEALMRLAFFAVKLGYNGLLDVNVVSEKVRMGSYQTTKWQASGVPAQVRTERLVKDRSIWQNPN